MNPDKIDSLLSFPPFGYTGSGKKNVFEPALRQSILFHFNNCRDLNKYYKEKKFDPEGNYEIKDVPYLPADLFKKRKMISVPEKEILYTLYSSATSGNSSIISLDRITSHRQQIISTNILIEYLGKSRKPYLILDTDPTASGKTKIKSRSAATRGVLPFASCTEYFLDSVNENIGLDLEKFIYRLKHYKKINTPVCIFGFTYILYINVIGELLSNGIRIELPTGSQIIHIGGWKKLLDQKVSKIEFLNSINEAFSIGKDNVFDIYGFTEQMGLLYINRGLKPKTVPIYSDLIIRDLNTLKEAAMGDTGLIQILTPFPRSYPGISILTGDLGRIVTEKSAHSSADETSFEIIGPSQSDEIRGCGDVLANGMSEK